MKSKLFAAFPGFLEMAHGSEKTFKSVEKTLYAGDRVTLGGLEYRAKKQCFLIERESVQRILDKDGGECVFAYFKPQLPYDDPAGETTFKPNYAEYIEKI